MNKKTLVLKLLVSVLFIAAAAISFGPASARLKAYSSENEQGLQDTLSQKSKEVLFVWGVTRGVSGLVSLLQSVQVSVGPGAVNPFEWLAAANNLLDKLSDICLYAVGAIMIEKFLLAVCGWAAFKAIIPVCMILCMVSLWIGKNKNNILKMICCFVLTGSAVCAAVPLSIHFSNVLEQKIFAVELDKTKEEIFLQNADVSALQENLEMQKNSTFRQVIDSVQNVFSQLTVFFSTAKDLVNSLMSNIINYIMIFAVVNIILPIVTIMGLWILVRHVIKLVDIAPAKTGP